MGEIRNKKSKNEADTVNKRLVLWKLLYLLKRKRIAKQTWRMLWIMRL